MRTSLRLSPAVLVLLVAHASPAAADRLPDHAVRVADYDIRVRLDPEAKTLDGQERIVWRNPSADAVAELWLHLYLNAFRNTKSTFFRESAGQLRGDRRPDDGRGWTDVTSVRLADGRDLLGGMTFEHPDDDNADDRSVVRVRLPEPVAPGASAELDLVFRARLPRIVARTGYVGDYFLVGHWFPKLGVYEPAGQRGRAAGGWNCHQFHAHSEFHADFGRYRVEITLPSRFVVGATGVRTARRGNPDGTATHVYEQVDVIDFAWAASPHLREIRRTFSAEKDVSPSEYDEAARLLGRSPAEVRLGDVEILLLLQPQHAPQAERHGAAAKAALKWFGLWYGRYPYRTLTVVDPGAGALRSGGMEYPTFVTAGTYRLLHRWPLDRVLAAESVVVHEVGHQFWQSMVATDEVEEPWLDEGVNSYSSGKVMERAYGPWIAEAFSLRLGALEAARIGNSAERAFDRIRTPAWGFSPGSYAFNVYSRAELTLRTLEGLVGAPTMARVMRTYHERWRFGHPTSEDFYAVAGEVSGRDLRSFFEQTVERPGVLDYEVATVSSGRTGGPRGRLEDDARSDTVSGDEAREKAQRDDAAGGRPWRSTVLVRRRGEVSLPVTIELQFEGGARQRRSWDGRDRWLKVEVETKRRLVAAVVDPDDVLVLDVNRLNNSRRVGPDRRAAAQWGVHWVFWLQQLLALAGL